MAAAQGGWSRFCKAKSLLACVDAFASTIPAGRNFALQNCCSPTRKGLQRKSFLRSKKIEAESPVSCQGIAFGNPLAGNAPKLPEKNVNVKLPDRLSEFLLKREYLR
jgi:hypothetical protein